MNVDFNNIKYIEHNEYINNRPRHCTYRNLITVVCSINMSWFYHFILLRNCSYSSVTVKKCLYMFLIKGFTSVSFTMLTNQQWYDNKALITTFLWFVIIIVDIIKISFYYVFCYLVDNKITENIIARNKLLSRRHSNVLDKLLSNLNCSNRRISVEVSYFITT